jgi:hypothetical protein
VSVWSKLFGYETRAAASAPSSQAALSIVLPSPGKPSTVSVLAAQLAVTLHAHQDIEGRAGNFLTAVSQGLSRHGQREIVLSLRLTSSQSASERAPEICRFLATVWHWAKSGKLVNAGELTQFGERGLFGRSHNGLLYTAARAIDGIELPRGALAAVLVDANELRLAMDSGAYRVLARIGEHERHFPGPLWSDEARTSVATERESESLLTKVRRARTRAASFLVEGKRVRVLLSPEVRAELRSSLASLPPGAPFALLTAPAASANAVLVWHPGQKVPKAISPNGSDGSRLSGSCLLISPGGQPDQARMLEDGYSLLFSDASWAKLADALVSGQPLRLAMADEMVVELEWRAEQSIDPRQSLT